MVKPTQADWVQAVYKLGVPSAIAVALVWFLMSTVSTALASVSQTLNRHQIESQFYLRGICLNTAHDEAERANCGPAPK